MKSWQYQNEISYKYCKYPTSVQNDASILRGSLNFTFNIKSVTSQDYLHENECFIQHVLST